MLVFNRHTDESAVLDLRFAGLGIVEILIVEIRGDITRIGIEAVRQIPVHRREVFDAIEHRNSLLLNAKTVKASASGGPPQ